MRLKLSSEGDCLTESGVIPDFRGTVGKASLSEAAVAAWHRCGGTAEADEVLIPKRGKWADQKQLTGTRESVAVFL